MGTRSTIFLRMIFLLAFIFLINPMAPAASDQPLIYLSGQTTFYAGQEVTLQWQQGARDSWQDIDRLNARLVYANKTILQQNLKPFFPLKFTFVYPELRDAISVDPVLVITASQNGQARGAVYQLRLFFYSPQHDFSPVFPAESVGVFDQTEDNKLAGFMDGLGIPYTPLMDFADFKGRWIICAGLDFDDSPSLFEELSDKSNQGTSILVLPPTDGNFPLPPYQKGSRAILADGDIIQDVNKNWNLATIKDDGAPPCVGFHPIVMNDRNVIAVTAEKEGYGWFEYRTGSARLIFLGWDLVSLAETNPSAKNLFYYLLTLNREK